MIQFDFINNMEFLREKSNISKKKVLILMLEVY
jgi:hypothetical protein